MRLVVAVVLMQTVGACGTVRPATAVSQEPPTASTTRQTVDHRSENQSVPAASRGSEGTVGATLRRSEVESGALDAPPRLVVHNDYVTTQYVLLGERLLGSVAPGEQASFELRPGPQRVTFSDAPNGKLNPKMLSEVFDAGLSYHYAVLAR